MAFSNTPYQKAKYIPCASSLERHILIVDDQETTLFFLRDRLQQIGFAVSLASNGIEGIGFLHNQFFHGILLALEMPVMDGFAMLHQLRQQSNTIPVIVMSGDPTRTTMIKAVEAGANDYLTKPISLDILQYKCANLFA